jgi:hypothetical protein
MALYDACARCAAGGVGLALAFAFWQRELRKLYAAASVVVEVSAKPASVECAKVESAMGAALTRVTEIATDMLRRSSETARRSENGAVALAATAQPPARRPTMRRALLFTMLPTICALVACRGAVNVTQARSSPCQAPVRADDFHAMPVLSLPQAALAIDASSGSSRRLLEVAGEGLVGGAARGRALGAAEPEGEAEVEGEPEGEPEQGEPEQGEPEQGEPAAEAEVQGEPAA